MAYSFCEAQALDRLDIKYLLNEWKIMFYFKFQIILRKVRKASKAILQMAIILTELVVNCQYM